MVAQLEFQGVGVQVALLHQVGFLVFPDIVIDQGHRHDERDNVASELIDDAQQVEVLAEIGAIMISDLDSLRSELEKLRHTS